MKKINQEIARIIIESFFKKIKVSKRIYRPVVDGLIETSLRGVDSHGIRLVPHYVRAAMIGRINKNPRFSFKKTSPTSGIFDADNGYGITAGIAAMDKAIKLARQFGIGAVVVKNSSHFGAAAIYGLRAAKKDLIGLALTNVEDLVVPYGGRKPFLGTNAFCFTAPMEEEDPFILDMATTNISMNKLRMYQREGKPVERGWAVDKNGQYVTNSREAVALTHFGSYKGYGIALMVEILCSLLSGGPYGPNITHMFPLTKDKRYLSHFFMVIDIKKFQSVAIFKKRLKEMSDLLRSQETAKGFKRAMVAGDPEKINYQKRSKEGIPITNEIIRSYEDLAKELRMRINWNLQP